MALMSLLVKALLELSPICLQNVPASTSPHSKGEACSLGSESPGALTGSAQTDILACFRTGTVLVSQSLPLCTIQERRALQIKNKMKLSLKSNQYTWMPFFYDSPSLHAVGEACYFQQENRKMGCKTLCLGHMRPSMFLLQGQAALSC